MDALCHYRLPAAQDFGFDEEEFRHALTPRTKVVVCISPSNPTGRTISREQLTVMASALDGRDAYVISDEIYRELYYSTETPGVNCEFLHPNTIVIGGVSKSLSMTGWRLGWLRDDDFIKSALVLHWLRYHLRFDDFAKGRTRGCVDTGSGGCSPGGAQHFPWPARLLA